MYLSSVVLTATVLLGGCSEEDGEVRRRSLGRTPSFTEVMRVADADRGGRLFGQCAVCHSIRPGGADRKGPALFGVVGQPIAGTSHRFAYTGALRAAGGIWTLERLDAWLAAPATFAPGTSMGFRGLPDALDRADLIAYLRAQAPPDGTGAPPSQP